MKNYISILVLGISLLAGCSKEIQLNEVAAIREYKLGNEKLFSQEIEAVHENTLGLSDNMIAHIVELYIDTADLTQYVEDLLLRETLIQELKMFYKVNNNSLAWSKGKKPLNDAKFLITQLSLASEEGLEPKDYNIDELIALQEQTYADKRYVNIYELIHLDLKMTGALLTYGWHLENGRIDPRAHDWRWAIDIPKDPVAARLSTAMQNKNLKQEIESLAPQNEQYYSLKKALEELNAMAYKGGWPILPSDIRLEEGDTSEFVPLLRERLIASNDLRSLWKNKLNSQIFDADLKDALADFQRTHGLEDDGILGNETLKMLNITVEEKIDIVKINMERLRWLPGNMAKDYLMVNIPEYKLKIFENNKQVWDMRVIVGKSYKNATPIFHNEIEYLVFSPTWGVPQSIIRDEMVPKIKRDPGYAARNGYQLYVNGSSGPVDPSTIDWNSGNVNLRMVQNPGPTNALGLVKFIMPNKYNIYLHDTPSDYLFERTQRDFSHGCVRLEKPKELAEYLLKEDNEWDPYRIEEYMYKGHASTVWLKKPVPVYIMYQTSFVDNDGKINFRKDVYSHDKNQFEQLISRKM